ncbi:MAG TPA: carboxypeptidase-like regulatory domain-containing protein [Candidatus Saccharimonadales bacterium]|nr:carboxypeptidase-like regulatory domain-containing protein [Candidatus Saccharimonadales bacterium]
MRTKLNDSGITIAEMLISIIVVSIVSISVITLFTSLVKSSVIAKRKAVASTLATNQMEYLKSLPYDNLVIAGGSIYTTGPTLPATTTQTIDNVKYTVTTSVSYVDDAYDGCGSYATQQLKQTLCRNYPPPAGAPATDTNPQDYKIIDISVSALMILASVNTQISARVAETASTTGALFVTVNDDSGNPISGANVNVANTSLNPALNLNDSTDINGVAIFYGLPPDISDYHYKITASKTDYSTLYTIAQSGSLVPNFSSQNILTQQSQSVTLTIMPQGVNSLILETTDTSGSPLANVKVYAKGGYKKYTDPVDTSYYYDNLTACDVTDNGQHTTDAAGLCGVLNLVPGNKWGAYIFCGDTASTNCKIGNTTYYLAAAIPYTSANALNPIIVPISTPAPPSTYTYDGNEYLQKVRLMLTTDSSFPRVHDLTPSVASQASGINNFDFKLNGQNLSGATVTLVQGSNNFSASCSGSSTQQDCTVDLSTASLGNTSMTVTVGGKTLTLPNVPLYGGLIIAP